MSASTSLSLHDYQIVAREYLRGRDKAALFLDMGLGKTAVVLSALEPRHLPALVVAPKRVAENVWHVEKELWRPDLDIAVAKGSPAARAELLASEADIVVLGRDNLRDVEKVRRKTPFRTIIIDELSGFKNRASVRWKTMRRLVVKPDVAHVWGLTGTPASNGYLDLWAQVALLDGGERLGRNITTYRSRYFYPGRQLPNGVIIEWLMREESERHIKEKIEDLCLAMETDGRIKLPDVTENNLAVELPPAVRKAYRTISNELAVDLREIFGGELHTAKSAGTLTTRLSQMAAGFVYVDDADIRDYKYTWMHNEKIDAVKEVVEASQGSPVLVFYLYQAEKEKLLEALGDQAHTIDEADVIERWNQGEIPVLLAHPASAGHGLNLQHGGHTIVWTSPTWDLELWEQGNKRLARQGQKHPVVIHVILANKTVDHLVRKRLEDKSLVQADLLAYLESPI